MEKIIPITTVDAPAFMALVRRSKKTFTIFKLETTSMGGIHIDLLDDTVICFGYSKTKLREGMAMFDGYKEIRPDVLPGMEIASAERAHQTEQITYKPEECKHGTLEVCSKCDLI